MIKLIILQFALLFFNTIHLFANSNNEGEKIVAGIEVGSKGVKLSIFSIKKSYSFDELRYQVIKDTSVNTNFINFNAESLEQTTRAFVGLYFIAKTQYNLTSNDVITAISSGVKQVADKNKKNQYLDSLINNFKIAIEEQNKEVEIISTLQESLYSFNSLIPEKYRYGTLLLDIGSGNSKGGYFEQKNKDFKEITINTGTKNMVLEADKGLLKSSNFKMFIHQLDKLFDNLEKTNIFYSINQDADSKKNNKIVLSGGISWAVSVLTHPENTDKTANVTVTHDDLINLYNTLCANFDTTLYATTFLPENLEPNFLKSYSKTLNTVLKTYDNKNLLAGTLYLMRMYDEFEKYSDRKEFILTRAGKNGWIPEYVLFKKK